MELTGKENVYLNGSILGLKNREITDRYQRIVEFAEIPDFMETPVKRYSSGMRVRLAFAVAAHLEPEILILDEVLAVGDVKFQEKCLNRIDEIRSSGVTVLFVSHSPQSVIDLCTRGIVLDDGRLISDGDAQSAAEKYMECLQLERRNPALAGIPESRAGRQAGAAIELLMSLLPEGRIVLNAPVETGGGICIADVGWISNSRAQTIRTEPTWSAAPDICVAVVSMARVPQQIENDAHHLLKTGAREIWIIYPDGTLIRHKKQESSFLIPETPHALKWV